MEQARPADGPQAPGQTREPSGGGEGGGYRFSLDVAGFALEELSATLEGRRLTVRARRRRRTEDPDGRVAHELREVRKALLLPHDADAGALACTLQGGRLRVEAPRRAPDSPRPDTLDGCGARPPPVGDRDAAPRTHAAAP